MDKVVILDRDGVVNENVYHPHHLKNNNTGYGSPFRPEDFKIIKGVPAAINCLREKGYRIFVASNQPTVAQGQHTVDSLYAMNEIMRKELGIPPENVFYCMHDIKSTCECRKPRPGLLLEAAKRHGFNIKDAVMIGDGWKDIAAGKAAGCRMTIYIGSKQGVIELVENQAIADARCASLEEAVRVI